MKELLTNNNLKVTKARIDILNIINGLKEDATVTNIIKSLSKYDKTTIYRTIDTFLNHNLLITETNYQEKIIYQLNTNHHDYFTCIKCHQKEELDICPIHEIEKKLTNDNHIIINHVVKIEGICKNCQINHSN